MSVHDDDTEFDSRTSSSFPITPLPISQPKRLTHVFSWNLKQRITTGAVSPNACLDYDYEASRLHRAVAQLQKAIMGDETLEPFSVQSWVWFQKYLDSKLSSAVWDELIVPVVEAVEEKHGYENVNAKTAVYTVIKEVANCLIGDGEVTIPSIVDQLREVQLDDSRLDKSCALISEGQREKAIHLVFHIVGWITGLWEPMLFDNVLPDLSESRLAIVGGSSQRKRTGILYRPVVRNQSLPLKGLDHQPLRQTADRFGRLFPVPELCLDDNTLGTRDIESACITTAYLSYHSLADIVDVTIAWTSTLGQHLEYDQRHKKLYVFEHPSICLLLYRKSSKGLLSEIFKPKQQAQGAIKQLESIEQVEFEDYLAEVLLSYRLVFAHDKRSRKLIGRDIDKLGPDCDVLLRTLCTELNDSENIQDIYAHLDADTCENYILVAEFPFLAKRFIQLQKASMGRNPHGIRRLWYDRRNPPAWFALWAVLLITGATLLLQFFQLVFQIYSPF